MAAARDGVKTRRIYNPPWTPFIRPFFSFSFLFFSKNLLFIYLFIYKSKERKGKERQSTLLFPKECSKIRGKKRMPSNSYQYLNTLILLACTCVATTLGIDSLGSTQNQATLPLLHHHNKNLLKHRAPPLDSGFDYSTLTTCKDASVSSIPIYIHKIQEGEGGGLELAGEG